MTGFLRFLALILISSTSFAQQGGLFQYLRLKPTTLPSYCTLGDVRFSSGSSLINYCSASNTWSALSLSSTAPMTTLGDMLYENGTPAPARLAPNTTTTKKFLTETGTGTVGQAPSWGQPAFSDITGTASLTTQVTGTLPVANGGTSLNSTGLGTILYGDGATSLTTLAGNTAASNLFLRSRGSGGVATAPTWSQVDFASVSGTADLTTQVTGSLPVGNGGTGRSTLTNHGVLVGAGITAVTQLAAAASGTVLTGQGSSADPSFTATPTLGVAGTTTGTLSFSGVTSGTVTIQPASAAGTWSMTLPTTAGSSGQFLKTDGTGVTSWTTGTGGSSVVSPGSVRICSGFITAPTTVTRSDGSCVATVTHTTTGDMTANFAASTFSAAPNCTVSYLNAANTNRNINLVSESSSAVRVQIITTTTGTLTDENWSLVCIGAQ